jgi:uncharacterized protein CbrC (UPF0167 family)
VSEELPVFRYHPSPVRTGSVVQQPIRCVACNRDRGYAYVGPTYSVEEIDEGSLCPWCIADGSAATKFDAEFADGHSLAGLADDVVTVVTARTPGYSSWQQDVWQVHCDDACAFLDRVGRTELEQLPPEAMEAMVAALRDYGRTESEREQFLSWLHRDGDLTGYLFQCLSCGVYLAHVDSS